MLLSLLPLRPFMSLYEFPCSSWCSAASESDARPAAAALTDSPAAAGRKGKGMGGGGGAAGPSITSSSTSTAPSSAALVAAVTPQGAPSSEDKSGGDHSKACAGCGAVGGKSFRCSRCLLVLYCSKDCQASDRWSSIAPSADRIRLFVLSHLSLPTRFIARLFAPSPPPVSIGAACSVFFAHSPPFHAAQ